MNKLGRNSSLNQPALWMRVRKANAQKPRISPAKLWGKSKNNSDPEIIQQSIFKAQTTNNVCAVLTYSNNLSLGDGGSDAPHEQGESLVQRSWSGRVVFGFFLFLLLLLRGFLRFVFCRHRRQTLDDFGHSETQSRMLRFRFITFSLLFFVILVLHFLLLLWFVRAVGIGVRVGVRLALRGARFVVAVPATLPLSSCLTIKKKESQRCSADLVVFKINILSH